MKLKGLVVGVNPDGKEVRKHTERKIKKLPKDNDFSAFQIGAGVDVVFVKATVTKGGELVRIYSTI